MPPAEGVSLVAYESDNQITNAGKQRLEEGNRPAFDLDSGHVQSRPPPPRSSCPSMTGPESELGVKVTSDYFGSIPPERLVVKENVIYFAADGEYRSKIGISPQRSKAVLGSYDADNRVLTIVQFSQPAGVTDYVNSLWKLQDNPYGGDAANSYNDGPPSPGAKPLGPFYELESSSPAAALAPGKSLRTCIARSIWSGPEAELDAVARTTLGVSLAEINGALKKP